MNNLIKLRKRNLKTQEDMAKLLRVSRTTYGKWELGTHRPDTDTLIKLANYFDVSIDYMLGNSNDPSPPGNEKKATVDDLAEAEGLGEENRKKLEDYLKLLKLSEMQQRNIEAADEFSVKE